MQAKTIKHIASNPEANPSNPSVKLTAFDVPVIINMINSGYSNPKSISALFRNGIETFELYIIESFIL